MGTFGLGIRKSVMKSRCKRLAPGVGTASYPHSSATHASQRHQCLPCLPALQKLRVQLGQVQCVGEAWVPGVGVRAGGVKLPEGWLRTRDLR